MWRMGRKHFEIPSRLRRSFRENDNSHTRKTIPPVAQASFKTIILQIFLLVAWFQVDSTTLAHKCSFRLCYSCVLNEVSIVLFSAED